MDEKGTSSIRPTRRTSESRVEPSSLPEHSTLPWKSEATRGGSGQSILVEVENPHSATSPPFQPDREGQHEIVYNRYLPYSVEDEAQGWLVEIKENLARCVLETDYRPGVFFWTTRLESYMNLYGRSFSKVDHVNFIKLYMELMLDPGMEPSLIQRFCKLLNQLLKKLELLSPEDLGVDWKPLYKLYYRIDSSKDQFHGVYYWPEKMEEHVRELIGYSRYYFPLTATQEMLDEWRPMLCPFDDVMEKVMHYFSMFLPTMLKPMHSKYGYELWLDEFLHIWLGFHGVPSWEAPMLQLFSRVAAENIGGIQWEKYVSAIFTKFLRTLELPVGKKQLQLVYSNESFDESSAVLWPIAMLHNESCLVALERLFKSVESYFHPSNYGNWTDKLSTTLMYLPLGVVARLQLERFRPKDWMPEIPREACLTNDIIKRFVTAFKPLAFLNLFSKSTPEEAVAAIQSLALMAPDEIFPDLLEKFFSSVETLTEPLRFQAIVCALTAALPFIFMYKDGKKNVVPLMLAMLPGIDSNDARKTTATLAFFSCLCTMVPLRPCFQRPDSSMMSDEEHEVCALTADFEDIVLQLLDRCLTMIDNFTVEPGAQTTAKSGNALDINMDEKIIKLRLEMLWLTIFVQVDDNIARLLIEKIFTASSTHIYPVQQLGAAVVSYMCAVAVRIRPEIAVPVLLHRTIRMLEMQLDDRPNLLDLTNLDDQLLWTLKLAGDLVYAAGRHVLDYLDRIKTILRRTLMMQCQSGHKSACVLARAVLVTLLRTHPTNYHEPVLSGGNSTGSLLENWGKRVQPHQVKVAWHVADEATVAVCSDFFQEFIADPLNALDQYAAGSMTLEDKKIQKFLHILEGLFVGISSHCNFDLEKGVPLPGYELTYPKAELPKIQATNLEITYKGLPVRTVLAETLHRVVDRVLTGHQDETKSLKSVLVLYRAILMSRGPSVEDFFTLHGTFGVVKREMENRLGPKKSRFRILFLEKARITHEMRCVFQRATNVTRNRLDILKDVVRLSVSRYKEVRSTAQTVFAEVVNQLHLTYRYALDDILGYLATSKSRTDDNDAQLKGSLHLLLGSKNSSYILKYDWETLRRVFPAIVEAQHSENPTVSRLFDSINEKCETMFVTTGLIITPCPGANKVAAQILGAGNGELEVIFDHALKLSAQKLELRNAQNTQLYLELVEHLVRLLNTPQIRLKNYLIGQVFLSYFIRKDIAPPTSIVRFTLERLLDSNDKTRRSSVLLMISIMRAIKPARKRIRIQPCHTVGGDPLPLPTTIGIREDNLWICVNDSQIPRTEEQYDSTVFIDKIWPGYYGWPTDGLEVNAPVNQQNHRDRTREEMSEIENMILERLTNEQYIASFIKFLSAEDFTHADFDSEIFLLLRGWFRHFRDSIVPLFIDHLKVLVKSHEEHQQRTAAEILTALIRGSKRWPYRKVSRLWQEITPLIQDALNSITGENQADWVAFGINSIGFGDMRQVYPLLQSVMNLSSTDTGFQTTSKLAVIHGIFECSDWRRRDLHYKVLELIESRLTDSYRDHVAFLLSVVFRHDINLPNIERNVDQGPGAATFFQKYYPQCMKLLENEENTTLGMLNLFKTIVKAIVTHVSSLAALRPDILQFYPLLCRFENDPRDADLAKDCILALTCFSQVFLSENAIPRLLQEVRSVVNSTVMPWRARVVALDNLQVCVFNNLLSIMDKPAWVNEVSALVCDRLLDEQIEVRQMASVTLTGFIQCNFVPMLSGNSLVGRFHAFASCHLPADRSSAQYIQSAIKRHAGVLGLSACIAAHPYEVPAEIPDILMVLGEHINDPPPINATVRATFSEFRRTHHDSWREHKEKFSDDQLALLTDLLVSPNYYA